MKLWLVSQNENLDYDVYDSFVVCCETEEEARDVDPSGWIEPGLKKIDWSVRNDAWAETREGVKVVYLGEAAPGLVPHIVCSSFNAG